jgi:pyridoxine/pyridoxamine 5'-phosphate oxidase
MDIAERRRDYTRASLDVDTVERSPLDQFALWFDAALKSECFRSLLLLAQSHLLVSKHLCPIFSSS